MTPELKEALAHAAHGNMDGFSTLVPLYIREAAWKGARHAMIAWLKMLVTFAQDDMDAILTYWLEQEGFRSSTLRGLILILKYWWGGLPPSDEYETEAIITDIKPGSMVTSQHHIMPILLACGVLTIGRDSVYCPGPDFPTPPKEKKVRQALKEIRSKVP